MSGEVLVMEHPEIGDIPLADRFRVPGGSVVHRAGVFSDDGDGFWAIVSCDTDQYRWFHESEDDRLDLIQPDDAEVTCVKCQEIASRHLATRRARGDGEVGGE